MSDTPPRAALSLVHEDSVSGDVDGDLYELHQQVVASEEHIANLEGELKGAADQEAGTAQILDSERKRRAALDQQLHEAREQAARLIHDEASQTRNALRAEAEELLQASRVEAEREAGQVTKRAFNEANEMLAEAKREATTTVDAGREELSALEADAAQRRADLDAEHRDLLTQKLSVMETLYNEFRETLQLVAETSVKELAEAQESLHQLDPAATQGPPSESTADQATDSGTEEGSVADQEAPSGSESVEPAPIEVPPLPGS